MRNLVFGAVVLCGCLGATFQAVAANDASPSSTPDPNEKVCIEMPTPTGSRVSGGKECHTRSEWLAMQHNGSAQAQMYDRNTPTIGGGFSGTSSSASGAGAGMGGKGH